jgi:hypothetical protein
MNRNNPSGLDTSLNVYSIWVLQLLDKTGNIKNQVDIHNLVTTQGKNFLLNAMFHGTTALNPWYIVLWTGAHVPLITDTYAVPGYTELNTEYDEATRPIYVESASSGGILSNAANRAVFTFASPVQVTGLSLVGGSDVKADIAEGTGILFCSARLTTAFIPAHEDLVNVLGTITVV